ncbi:MAG: hypothetical protein ACE5MB_02025 [Anaerolineae bacterium]
MSHCCPTTDDTESCAIPAEDQQIAAVAVDSCPVCGQKGKPVKRITMQSLLAISLLALRHVPYRFCLTPHCPVVYFATDGGQTFTTDQVRERVHQKNTSDDVPVCYCFRFTPADIRGELAETGTSTVAARISQGVREGRCACEIRNPQGSCCLGNVQAVVKRVEAALAWASS